MKKINFLLLSIVVVINSVSAHKVLLMAEDNGDGTVYVEAGLSTGDPLTGNEIEFKSVETGKKIWSGILPESGSLNAPMPKVPYIISLIMGVGHYATKRGPLPEDKVVENSSNKLLQAENISTKNVDNSTGKVVVASMPVIQDILKNILDKTDIAVINPLPKFSTVDVIDEFAHTGDKKLDSLAPYVDAVVDIRSIWPKDNLYNYLRKKNIRIVEIDAATSFDPLRANIGLLNNSSDSKEFVWLSISNLIHMADIISTDMKALFPLDSTKINNNMHKFSNKFLRLKTEYEMLFVELDNFEAITMSDDFYYLLSDINLFVVNRFSSDVNSWSEKDSINFKNELNNKMAVIHKYKPDNSWVLNLLNKNNVSPIVLKTGEAVVNNIDGIYGLIRSNYNDIYKGLGGKKNVK